MSRKGENIYKRKDGRWEGRYIKQRTSEGKIIYGYIYGKKYGEVKKKLTILKAQQFTAPITFDPFEGTYGEWLCYWLHTTARKRIKVTTFSHYSRLSQRYILPGLGSQRLLSLNGQHIQHYVDQLITSQLAAGTIRVIMNLVKQSFSEAISQHYLQVDPCATVIIPKSTGTKVNALSIEQQRHLEMLALQEVACSPIILALYSGMRIGEISGLQWQDIDFESEVISVDRTITRVIAQGSTKKKTALLAGPPKTAQSSRKIPLAPNLKTYLLAKKQRALGDFVIECRGKLAEPRVINYRFKKLIKDTSFSEIHFHALRHTFATRCLEQNVDIASLSKILGHQSTKMTLDTYADSLLEQRKKAMAVIDSMLHLA